MTTTDIIFVYIPCPDNEAAQKVGAALVEQRLAACVNILPGMQTIYRWEGEMKQEQEVLLIAKTKESLFKQVEGTVRELHPYQTPCVAAIAISDINRPYFEWLLAETRR